MRSLLARIWRWDADLDRGPYFLIGLVLLQFKHLLDFVVAVGVFQRFWHPLDYFVLPTGAMGLLRLPPDERLFYATLLFLALPFIYLGVLLTVQRLRSADLPTWLVIFFFLPVVNIFFFLLLSVLPGKVEAPVPVEKGKRFLIR